jgi:soluble lytic murein transglycosylase
MTTLRRSIPISASAQGRIRLILALTATAGLLAAAATLRTNFPWGTPVIGKTSAIVLPVGSGSDPRLGLTRDWVPWSSPPAATRSAQVIPQQCPERNFVDDAGALPSPCRVGVSAPAQSLVVTLSPHGLALKAALDAIDKGDLAGARAAAREIDVVAEDIVSWMAATSRTAGIKSSEIEATIARLGDWPGQSLLRARYEEALARERPDTATVLKVFARVSPSTAVGTILFAKALTATGNTEEAEGLIRRYWREELISSEAEPAILSAFGAVLTEADHQARVARLVYQGRTADAAWASRLLDKGPRELVKAWIAVTKQRRDAGKLLDKLAADQRQDPAYLFARIQSLRQAGHIVEAAAMMQSAPAESKALIDPDAWSEERRLLARLVAAKDPHAALSLTSVDLGASAPERMGAEFEAGWYALRYLNDPVEATKHFGMTASLATTPANQSRAEYWLGRASDAAGQSSVAAEHYRAAGRFPTTFYGQLALVNLGSLQLPIAPPPTIDETIEQHFREHELVQVAARLASIGRHDEAEVFCRHLARMLTDPAEIALLAAMAQDQDNYSLALQVGKVANARQAGVDAVAFPMASVPSLERADVELPAVYAVARQESAFTIGAVSPAGARGLLQLMPATAKEVAGRLGLPYSEDRLSTDAAYNTTLGAAFLGSLVARFNGSYAMSFAAYNAGQGRVQEWAKTYGDPRGRDVDVVDWIERIPFDETRNYVQRTLENLQVYRARLGSPELRLGADLTGHPGDWLDPLTVAVQKPVPEASPKPPVLRHASGRNASHVAGDRSACSRYSPVRVKDAAHRAGRHCVA